MKKTNKISALINGFFSAGFKYLFSNNSFVFEEKARFRAHSSTKIRNSKIYLAKDSELTIDEGSKIENVDLYIDGKVTIGKNNLINNKDAFNRNSFNQLKLFVKGELLLGDFNRIRSNILIRFNANVSVGSYTNINYQSEIRCDEKISIGSFNQISYNVMLWDTDTHNIYQADKRREISIKTYPKYGWESHKPKTSSITIGDDCWIGKNVSILKGSKIENKCIIGVGTKLINISVEKNSTVYSKDNVVIKKNDI